MATQAEKINKLDKEVSLIQKDIEIIKSNHLFHIEKSKSRLELNNDIELRTINEKLSWTENGIDKYLKVL